VFPKPNHKRNGATTGASVEQAECPLSPP